MKRCVLSILLCFVLLFSFVPVAKADSLPNINASGFVLCNSESGEILDTKNPDLKLYPASLTKVMTALLTVELSKDIDKEVATVSEEAINLLAGTRSSVANIQPGEEYSLRELLYLLMLPSGNDAANVLAEYFSGSNEEFAKEMNKKAKELGMENSNFVNPHGLHDENHYTTARDMAILSVAYLKHPVLKEVCSATEYTSTRTDTQPARKVETTNLFKRPESPYYYPTAYGLKTGNTNEAGRCLISAAENEEIGFVCVMLNCPTMRTENGSIRTEYIDSKAVLEYAFQRYEYRMVYPAGTLLEVADVNRSLGKSVSLITENDLYVTLPKTDENVGLTLAANRHSSSRELTAPIKKGTAVGTAVVTYNGQTVATSPLVTQMDVELNIFIRFWQAIDLYVYLVLGFAAALVLLFIVLVIRAKIIRYRRRKRKARRRSYYR